MRARTPLARVLVGALVAAGGMPVHAEETVAPPVRALAEINGLALACGPGDIAKRAKNLMIAHAPKTPVNADAFDEGTRRAFLGQTKGNQACPDAATLAARLDAVEAQLRIVLPARAPADAGDSIDADDAPRITPRYLLEGPGGRAVTSEDFQGRFQLVAFGYTSCPDVCPTTLVELQQVMETLGKRASAVQPIFITVDPQRDTPVVREAYTRNFDARILPLGGSDALVRRAADAFNVRYEKVQAAGAAPNVYTVDHTAGLFLIGPDGQLLERIVYGTPAREIAARLERWMEAARHRSDR